MHYYFVPLTPVPDGCHLVFSPACIGVFQSDVCECIHFVASPADLWTDLCEAATTYMYTETDQEHVNVCLLCFGVRITPSYIRMPYRHSYNAISLWLWLHKVGIIQTNAYVRYAKMYLLRVAFCFSLYCTVLASLFGFSHLAAAAVASVAATAVAIHRTLYANAMLCYAMLYLLDSHRIVCTIPRTEKFQKFQNKIS